MTDPVIDIKNLSVIYNQGKSNEMRALEDVTISIYPNEYIVIYGPSGCGKSTLLYSISGLQKPTAGEVTLQGRGISKMSKKEMVQLHQVGVGMIFQAFYLIDSLKVIDNVCLPKVFCGAEKHERREAGLNLLRRFGILEQEDKYSSALSGGQKQRVAIARSLVNNPEIILADEPVGNLDSESAQNVMDILKELNEVDKKTIILVTHNPEHLRYADRVLHMKDGRLVNIEVNKEKRPKDVIRDEIQRKMEDMTDELKILMRTFRNLSPQQLGVLLVPFKAKQLMSHILSDLTEEQYNVAEGYMRELLFYNIDVRAFEKKLDADFSEGGANWNKLRAHSFTRRAQGIISQVGELSKDSEVGIIALANYLIDFFDLNLDMEIKLRLRAFLKLRITNKIDAGALRQRLDASIDLGGIGLRKGTAEKIMREVEMIMLLKYAA